MLHRKIRDKRNGIQFCTKILISIIYGLELFNEYYDPFEFNLTGWSKYIDETQDDYYEVSRII